MHLLLTGGGTAGHIMPNLALIESLKKSNPKISYIGSKTGLEVKLLESQKVDFYPVYTGKFRRYFDIQNFIDIFRVIAGFFQSLILINRLKPDLIFSKGGYVALPVVIAGWILRVPIVIHESDSVPGLTTKITAKFATRIWGANINMATYFDSDKYQAVNLPIRSFLSQGNPDFFRSKLSFNSEKPTLLVMGGSLGAGAINDFVTTNLDYLTTQFNIIHICGKGKLNQTLSSVNNYYQVEYLDDEMNHAYAAADFILSRAGASAIAEITALKKKSILVPLPKTQSRGEQLINADYLAKTGLAVVINQSDLNVAAFEKSIQILSASTYQPKLNPSIDFAPDMLLGLAKQ